jgi:hypothetical protein
MKLKIEFKTIDENGKEIELAVNRPTPKIQQDAQAVYNTAFAAAVRSKALLREALYKYMEDQGVWGAEQQKELEEIQERIQKDIMTLEGGGIKKSQAKALCFAIRLNRWLIREKMSLRTELDAATVEGQAENARFDYLVSQCVVYNNTGEPYFKDLENYFQRRTERAAIDGASQLAFMMNDLDPNYEHELPENKLLKKFGFVNENLHLVNEKGQLVDFQGRLVNEDGDLIDEDGNVVEPKVETKPFLNEDGTPIEE